MSEESDKADALIKVMKASGSVYGSKNYKAVITRAFEAGLDGLTIIATLDSQGVGALAQLSDNTKNAQEAAARERDLDRARVTAGLPAPVSGPSAPGPQSGDVDPLSAALGKAGFDWVSGNGDGALWQNKITKQIMPQAQAVAASVSAAGNGPLSNWLQTQYGMTPAQAAAVLADPERAAAYEKEFVNDGRIKAASTKDAAQPLSPGYGFQQIGDKLFRTSSLTGEGNWVNGITVPGYASTYTDRDGNLRGITNGGVDQVIREKASWQTLDPQVLEDTRQREFGQNLGMVARGQDVSANTAMRGQNFQLAPELGNLGLNQEKFKAEILRNPSDYVYRSHVTRGQASPFPKTTMADILNGLNNSNAQVNAFMQSPTATAQFGGPSAQLGGATLPGGPLATTATNKVIPPKVVPPVVPPVVTGFGGNWSPAYAAALAAAPQGYRGGAATITKDIRDAWGAANPGYEGFLADLAKIEAEQQSAIKARDSQPNSSTTLASTNEFMPSLAPTSVPFIAQEAAPSSFSGGFAQTPAIDYPSSLVSSIPSWYSNPTTPEDYAGLAGEEPAQPSLQWDAGSGFAYGTGQQPILRYAYGTQDMPRYGFGTAVKKAVKKAGDKVGDLNEYLFLDPAYQAGRRDQEAAMRSGQVDTKDSVASSRYKDGPYGPASAYGVTPQGGEPVGARGYGPDVIMGGPSMGEDAYWRGRDAVANDYSAQMYQKFQETGDPHYWELNTPPVQRTMPRPSEGQRGLPQYAAETIGGALRGFGQSIRGYAYGTQDMPRYFDDTNSYVPVNGHTEAIVGDSTSADPAAGGARPEELDIHDPSGQATFRVRPMTDPYKGEGKGMPSFGETLIAIGELVLNKTSSKTQRLAEGTGFMPQIPTSPYVSNQQLMQDELFARPPAVNSVLTGERPAPLRFGFALPTIGMTNSLTPDEQKAFRTALAFEDTTPEDVATAQQQQFGATRQRPDAVRRWGY